MSIANKAKIERDGFDSLRSSTRILYEQAVEARTLMENVPVIYIKEHYIDLLTSLKPIYFNLSRFPFLLKNQISEHRPLTKELMDPLNLEYSKEQHIYETDLELLNTDAETLTTTYNNFIVALKEYKDTERNGDSVNMNRSIMASTFVSKLSSMHERLHTHRGLTEELILSYLDDHKNDDDHDDDNDRHGQNNMLRLLVLLLAMGVVGVIIFLHSNRNKGNQFGK